MFLCTCLHCDGTFNVTIKPKICLCGAMGAMLTSANTLYITGPHILIDMPDIDKKAKKDQILLATISDVNTKGNETYGKHSLERQY